MKDYAAGRHAAWTAKATHVEPATARAAAWFVASRAHDAADLALLLDALGLDPAAGREDGQP